MQQIFLYDTTLRDGTQGEDVSFSAEDKIKIAKRLDAFGVTYIEGGWPGSNPKDMEFFERARTTKFTHAKIAAFGSTRRAKNPVEKDANIRALVGCTDTGCNYLRQNMAAACEASTANFTGRKFDDH